MVLLADKFLVMDYTSRNRTNALWMQCIHEGLSKWRK